jgi:hypothetical protein
VQIQVYPENARELSILSAALEQIQALRDAEKASWQNNVAAAIGEPGNVLSTAPAVMTNESSPALATPVVVSEPAPSKGRRPRVRRQATPEQVAAVAQLPTTEIAAPIPSEEETATALKEYANRKEIGIEGAVGLLQRYGVGRLRELPADKRAALIAETKGGSVV